MVSFSISGLSAQRSFRRSRSCSVAVLIIALAIALSACSPQAPQRPSQRSGQSVEPDSATLAIVELHRRLADAAEVELNNYIRNHPGQWFAQDDGSWYSPNPSGVAALAGLTAANVSLAQAVAERRSSPQDGLSGAAGPLSLRLITRDLDGKLLSDVQGEYELGKCQLPSSVEKRLSAQRSSHFKVLAPWYVAYGSKGNEAVPGYQNVTIEVYIL